jgi:uncharacterized protein YjbI with pentapeptide repeats
MTRDETIALWNKCQEVRGSVLSNGGSRQEAQAAAAQVWNAWADLTITNLQQMSFDQRTISNRFSLEGRPEWKQRQSKDAQAWLEISKADFSEMEIEVGAPQLTIDFTSFRFPGEVDFTEATFKSYARFRQVHFRGPTWFRSTIFTADANFQSTSFDGVAWFRSAKFQEYATFEKAVFHAEADFFAATFSHGLLMSNANFIEMPQFNQVILKEAPELDAVVYPVPSFRLFGRAAEAKSIRYRAIRRLAMQGHDYENEAKAFKGEMRSKRGSEQKVWHAVFWFSMLYDAISDFGRSILRPLLIWVGSIPIFTIAYLMHAGKIATATDNCANGSIYGVKALFFALKNSVLFVSWDGEQVRSAYACLYDQLQGQPGHAVPASSAFIQAAQSVWSAVLIFFILLAVRNQFKIK